MIERIKLIKNVGQFDYTQFPNSLYLKPLTLIYAENAKGKTTLCSILHSLSTGEQLFIRERSRIGAQSPPNIIIQMTEPQQTFVFQNWEWNSTYPNIAIFDDLFIDQNVFTGLEVTSSNRQNLHEVIIGTEGVSLARTMQTIATDIISLNSEIKKKADKIPAEIRKYLTIDDFCSLKIVHDLDNSISKTEKLLDALAKSEEVRNTPLFEPTSLPTIEKDKIESLTTRTISDLDTKAFEKLREHFFATGSNSEQWIADGLKRIPDGSKICPFCAQHLGNSELFSQYRTYFSEEYNILMSEINSVLNNVKNILGADALTKFIHIMQLQFDRYRFWSKYMDMPLINQNMEKIAAIWQSTRDSMISILEKKKTSPLKVIQLDVSIKENIQRYLDLTNNINAFSAKLISSNEEIKKIKSDSALLSDKEVSMQLNRLKAVKSRYSPEISPLCEEYLQDKEHKEQMEIKKKRLRQQLDQHRNTVFPAYRASINEYLNNFGTTFRIEGVSATNPSGKPSSNYHIVINNSRVDLSGSDGKPSFKNTLSAGDRNSLALAFFLSALNQKTDLSDSILVFDDPVSSLDEHRKRTTVQEILRLSQKVSQTIVLSHDRRFLRRIIEKRKKESFAAFQIKLSGNGSVIEEWDTSEEFKTEYDHRYKILSDYLKSNRGDPKTVAESIRYVIEGYLRVIEPEYFPSGSTFKEFSDRVKQHLNQSSEILNEQDYQELNNILDYAHSLHHYDDTIPITTINEAELHTFVKRTLCFVRKR